MPKKRDHSDVRRIELFRGGSVVSTLIGTLGNSLRETRITAFLGYVISLQPEPFLKRFRFPGTLQSVQVEVREEDGRSDIVMETSQGRGIVEAKVSMVDPFEQARRYNGKWVALLTNRVPNRIVRGDTRYIPWEDIANDLAELSNKKTPTLRILSADLLRYLQEHRMVKKPNAVEIYAREINSESTLKLFLGAQLYTCKYEAGSKMAEALYFAPHFGRDLANKHFGIRPGISYISQIATIRTAKTWNELNDVIRRVKGSAWLSKHQEILKELKKEWTWGTELRSLLFLRVPRRAFNPPVQKSALQRGSGWLSKRFLTFDDLLGAFDGTRKPTLKNEMKKKKRK